MLNSNLISRYRAQVQVMLDAFADCRALEGVITSQGGTAALLPGDFSGTNADLDPATFAAIVTSREAIETFTRDGYHYSNLDKALA